MTKPVRPIKNYLAAIHMAHKVLGLSKDDALALKQSVTGVASAGDMTDQQRKRYLAHLSSLQTRMGVGTQRPKPTASQKYTPKRAPAQRSPEDSLDMRWGKARAQWAALAKAGAVKIDTDAALMAYVQRQTHLEHWRFLNSFQINNVIESLKRWYDRLEPSRKQAQPEGQAHG